MSTLAKVFVVSNLFLSLVFVTISGVLFAHEQHWKDKAESRQALVEKWRGDYDVLADTSKQRIDGLVRDKTELKSKLDDKEDEVTQKNTQITTLKNTNTELADANKRLQQSYEALDQRWKSTDQQRKTVMAELDRRTAELARLREAKSLSDEQVVLLSAAQGESKRTIGKLEDQIAGQQKEIDEKGSVLAAAKRIAPNVIRMALEERGVGVVPPVRGKVLGVSEETKIVLLSVGREDKVEPNMKFIIYRGAEFVGEVTVEKVLAQRCSARITLVKEQIMVGDEAATETAIGI